MSEPATCWTLIAGAAAGRIEDRSEFAHRYLDVVRSALAARWRGTVFVQLVDDAVQEVFLECFRVGGVLAKADPERPESFRSLLFGVVRNVAHRCERRSARAHARDAPSGLDDDALVAADATLSKMFDRQWARSLVRLAVDLMERRARVAGADSAQSRRVALLRLRFEDGMPVRDIAADWGADPAGLHEALRQARRDFQGCLREIVAFHSPQAGKAVDEECRRLLEMLE